MRKKIVPGEPWVASGGLYDRWDYLKDAAKGWKSYWQDDLHKYFGGSFEKHPDVSTWDEWKGVVWFLVIIAIIVLVLAYIGAHQSGYQIIQPKHPRQFPTFTTAPQ